MAKRITTNKFISYEPRKSTDTLIMNADVLRQRKAANGRLFDLNGNSSMGMLPAGEIRIKQINTVLPTADDLHDFQIGSRGLSSQNARVAVNYEEGKDAEFQRIEKAANLGSVKLPVASSFGNAAKIRASQSVVTELDGKLNMLPGTNGFLNQGTQNPVQTPAMQFNAIPPHLNDLHGNVSRNAEYGL